MFSKLSMRETSPPTPKNWTGDAFGALKRLKAIWGNSSLHLISRMSFNRLSRRLFQKLSYGLLQSLPVQVLCHNDAVLIHKEVGRNAPDAVQFGGCTVPEQYIGDVRPCQVVIFNAFEPCVSLFVKGYGEDVEAFGVVVVVDPYNIRIVPAARTAL